MTGPIATTLPRSRAEIEAIQRARKVEAVRQAMRAEFYRGKLDHIDLSQLDDPAEWAKIPLLDTARQGHAARHYRRRILP
jgi:hypothetical protein